VLWGIIIGMLSLGGIPANGKAVAEGKIAGKMTYDVIDRAPLINQDG